MTVETKVVNSVVLVVAVVVVSVSFNKVHCLSMYFSVTDLLSLLEPCIFFN